MDPVAVSERGLWIVGVDRFVWTVAGGILSKNAAMSALSTDRPPHKNIATWWRRKSMAIRASVQSLPALPQTALSSEDRERRKVYSP